MADVRGDVEGEEFRISDGDYIVPESEKRGIEN